MTQTDAMVKLSVRLPHGTWEALRQTAEDQQRSLNGQLLVALEGWLFGNGPEWFRAELVAERTARQRAARAATSDTEVAHAVP